MATRKHESDAPRGNDVCGECGTCLSTEALKSKWTGPIVHCEGSVIASRSPGRKLENPHHGHVRYGECWSCHAYLGCDRCAGSVTQVMCGRCVCQGTPEALAEHGVFLNTPVMIARRHGHVAHPLSSYPPHFQAAWRRQVAADPDDFAQLYAEYRTELEMNPADAEKRMGARLRAVLASIGRPMPEGTAFVDDGR